MNTLYKWALTLCTLSAISILAGCQFHGSRDGNATAGIDKGVVESVAEIVNDNIIIRFNKNLHSRVYAELPSKTVSLNNDFSASEYLVLKNSGIVEDFRFLSHEVADITNEIGEGTQHEIIGRSSQGIVKKLDIVVYDEYPESAFLKATYRNDTGKPIRILKWVSHNYQLLPDSHNDKLFWSFQGASYSDRRDWIQPVKPGFEQQNYMGMNASDYGGGTPVTDIWNRDIGLGIGHIELTPKLVSLPVTYSNEQAGAEVHIEYERPVTLQPGEHLTTFDTFVSVHQKDYFRTLVIYRKVMAARGLKAPDFPDASYEPIWCAWGYDRDFEIQEVLQTLPKAKEMGFEWAVLDDGWQTSEGDWYLDKTKFPDGDSDMKKLVSDIKDAGLKAKLWWAPLAVDPGTDLIRDHRDMLLLDKDGEPVDITWWDSYYLCPAYAKTQEYSVELVRKMMAEWGYEGLKIDGQHLNAVPPCYNPAHNHDRPEESVEALQEFWKLVYETAQQIDEDSVIEICPCGTSYAFHNTPYMNQSVSSDPLSSWQVRTKGKTLKALMGESSPYYGDHVELSDDGSDFASSVGIGAVIGTKFTWPVAPESDFALTPEKEKVFQKWVDIYKEKMLPKGMYRGELYDIGFDKPETHAISKAGAMYYAFYDDNWTGTVELRGLEAGRTYEIRDYVKGKVLARVNGPIAILDVAFTDHLLIEATPVD